jgi:hypothetical protein
MKRLLIVLIALVAVFALVLPASAADFKFGGMFWTKFYATDNIRDGVDGGGANLFVNSDGDLTRDPGTVDDPNARRSTDDAVSGFYTRMRMYFTAIASENLKAVSKVEVDSVWGDGRIGRVSVDGGSDGRGDAGNASANSGWEIKNAYIDFNIPDTALNFQVGLLGHKMGQSGIVFADDTPAIVVGYTYDPIKFSLMYSRLNDNMGFSGSRFYNPGADPFSTPASDNSPVNPSGVGDFFAVNPSTANNAADDWDMWGLDVGYKWEAFSANLAVGYIVSGENTASFTTAGSDDNDFDLWVIGVDADYKADMWSVYLTGAFNLGTNEGANNRGIDPDGNRTLPQDEDFKGWMVSAGGDYNLSDMFTVGLDFYYASGDDNANDGDMDAFHTPGIIGRPSYYMDDIVFPGWFDDESSTVATLAGGGTFWNNATATGLTASNQGYTMNNIMAIGAHVDIKPLEHTLLQPGIAWMKFAEDVYSQIDEVTGPTQKDDDLGFSAYVRLNQGITDGLALKATFGYLFTGDGYSALKDEDDAYKFATGLFWSW